ncbi:MAG: tyrosine-type recombinase/integrase, partial [candidate division Zixibacteria bacterium]|nr:tyrosine-type recombinase/integrase [candidate division Zixibacteria bacterium]
NIYSLTSRFKRFLVRIGIDEPGVAFHTLRHTYITFLLLHGASPRIVMELARIRDLKTLMNYSHVYENHKQSSIEKIGF